MVAVVLLVLACDVAADPPRSSEPPATEPPATEPPAAEPPAAEPPAPLEASQPPCGPLEGGRWVAVAPGEPLAPGPLCLDLGADRGARWDSEALENLLHGPSAPQVAGLRLAGQPVGPAGAKAIAASPSMLTARELDLRGSAVGATGARALAYSRRLDALDALFLREPDVADADALQQLRDRFGGRLRLEP